MKKTSFRFIWKGIKILWRILRDNPELLAAIGKRAKIKELRDLPDYLDRK
jgi:hypothetical protein